MNSFICYTNEVVARQWKKQLIEIKKVSKKVLDIIKQTW